MHTCNQCGDTNILNFYIRKSRNKPFSKCKKCYLELDRANSQSQQRKNKRRENIKKLRELDPLIDRKKFLKLRYGISLDDYNELLLTQGGCCKICKLKAEDNFRGILYVDHCHKTGKIRGLLCDLCNKAIGLFKDDISLLAEAINYLR